MNSVLSNNEHRDETSVDLLVVSDIHGRFISKGDQANDNHQVGLDRFANYLKNIRELNPNVFVINNGDAIQGSPLVDLHNFRSSKSISNDHPLNVVQNYLNVDCFVPGNHEFNFGFDYLKQVHAGSNATWLAANIYYHNSDNLVFEPYKIFQSGDIKIGVIGVVTDFVSKWESKQTIAGLEFRNAVTACRAYIPIVKSQCDFLIVSYHGGLKRNPENGEIWSIGETTENQGIEIWESGDDIDLLITGHQHRQLLFKPRQKNRAVLLQPSCFSKHWAHIRLTKHSHPASDTNLTIDTSPGIVAAEETDPDGEIKNLLKHHLVQIEKILTTPVGSVDQSFLIHDPMKDVWLNKHPLIQWINQLMCRCAKVDISAIPLLNPKLKGLSGNVTIEDILSFFFFQDAVCAIEITGHILKKALEKSAGFFQLQPGKNGENVISINPNWRKARVLSYNYDMWEGIEYEFDIRRPIGKRLVFVKRNGRPIDNEEKLRIAVTSYRSGGAFYDMLSPEFIVKEFPDRITDLMIRDLREKKQLSISPTQNFNIKY